MIKADFHSHTSFSGDCKTPMEDQIKKAIELGLEHFCFTDHIDIDFPKKYGYFDLEIDDYVKHVLLMQEKYKKKINLYLGIEFGLIPEPGYDKKYEDIANKYPFDFILGSTHLIDWKDPFYPDYWEDKSRHQGILEYFNTVRDNINNYGNFDSLGHVDYIARYANIPEHPRRNKDLCFDNYEYEIYKEVLNEILSYLIKNDKALEINTAGYKKGLGAPNPQYSVLKNYREMGGKLITIGSDGHAPHELAYEFDRTRELLLAVGYKEYFIYKDRKPVVMKL